MKPFRIIYTFPFVLSLAAIAGCSDDLLSDSVTDIYGKGTDEIGFVVSSNNVGITRSADDSYADGLVLRAIDSKDSLFVSTKIENITDEAPSTRGTAIESTLDVIGITASCYIKDATNGNRVYFQNQPYNRNAESGLFAHKNEIEYYWLSRDAFYEFYNTTPLNATGLSFNGDGYSTFQYTVPTNATDQQDLMTSFATTERTAESDPSTSYGFPVNVKFNHALTQISVKQGEGMSIGTINSISFTGVSGTGTFNIKTNSWTAKSDPNTFTYTYGQATANGASVTGENGNFFMIPQDLSGAEMHVSFTKSNGTTEVFSAPLSGEWIQGQHVTYTITINQDIEFEVLTGNYIDAHYDRFSVKITPKDLGSSQSWTVASTLSDVTMLKVSDYTSNDDYKLLRDGYWTDKFTDGSSARGTASLTFTGNTAQTIWVFVPENIGESDRKVPLTVSINGRVVCTDKSVTQYCPYWDENGYGGEHIDTSDGIVWGFSWSGSETYTSENFTLGLHWLDRLVYNNLNSLVSGKSYITYTTSKVGLIGNTTYFTSLTIHYDQITLQNAAESDANGLQNTSEIYNFNGFADLNTIISTLQSNGYVSSSGSGTAINPSNSAAAAVVKNCNKWNVEKSTSTEGNVYTIQFLGIDWYLPAVNQCNSTTFTGASGIYWTSSAIPDSNTLSDTYTAPSGQVGSDNRQSQNRVRAFRNRP